MRKVTLGGRKRYAEVDQFTTLANMLKPKAGVEWMSPDDADQLELEISRAPAMDEDYERLAQRRDALFNPLWKEATRRYPPKKGDQGIGDAADHRGHMVVLRRQPDWLHAFHQRAGLYRAAWICRQALTAIARAASARAMPLSLNLPPAQPQVEFPQGKLRTSRDFYLNFFIGALEEFDCTLIRLCSCGNVYIAKRRKQEGCSKRCSNRQRQQRKRDQQKKFRESHPDYHRQHSRAARALESLRRAITVPVEVLNMAEVV